MRFKRACRMSDDRCYECTGDGDDYVYDEDTGEYVRVCEECLWNEEQEDE